MNKQPLELSNNDIDEILGISEENLSGLFRCPVCKSKDTTYEKKQTRSADEGMTTVIICNKCGYRR